jgi:transglycosylase-like protein with SLT domain/D-alanyl-D-alanine carboxypeptidase-like protein/putative Flp pilus-assembly TadE/G-like protein
MTSRWRVAARLQSDSGQSALLLLGALASLLVGVLFFVALGQALGARSKHQRAADLAAVSAARAMADVYPRLFEPPVIDGVPNPHHLSLAAYLALARRTAVLTGLRNGVPIRPQDVRFPPGFAPARVAVLARGHARVRVKDGGRRVSEIPVRARATAELAPGAGGVATPGYAHGGGYSGPLAYRQGKPMRPDVARAFDRLVAAARREAGLNLIVVSGFRSDAEQARLFAAHPDPKWVAPPGKSLHRYGTELDLGPNAAYGWLGANAKRFGFVQRYSWEKWHFGYIHNAGSASLGYGRHSHDDHSGLPSFVPARFQAPIARAAQRWNVGAALLAAQLYAESGFNPFARSPAGAQGIAQFMPGTALGYGLRNPFDPVAAIDAQAHLMRDLLRRFASVPLALAAYNAGSGAVAGCMCVPAIPETRAYVARILGLLGGAGEIAPPSFAVRLIE